MGISKIDGSLSREGIEENLQIKGIKVAPENLDNTFVKYTYETSQLGFLEECRLFNDNEDVGGSGSHIFDVIGPGDGPILVTDQQNAKILGISCGVIYDAAGVAADSGGNVVLRTVYRLFNGSSTVEQSAMYHTVLANNTTQYFAGYTELNVPIIVPWNWKLSIQISRNTGAGNFPANTTLIVRGSAHLRKRGLFI